MTDQREIDRVLDAFLAEGTGEVADRVIDAALDQIDHTRQRRALRMPRRFSTMTMPIRLAAAAVIGVLAVGGALYLTRPGQPGGRWSGPGAQCERQPEPARRDAHPDARRVDGHTQPDGLDRSSWGWATDSDRHAPG